MAMHFLVFQHVGVEHPGIFRDFWAADGISWDTVELDAGEAIPDDLNSYDALIVMGGPMDVWQVEEHPWLTAEIAAIRHCVVDLALPYFGVCLGHQLLAAALGSEIRPARGPEVGPCEVQFTPEGQRDPLFAGLADPLLTFQWHGAEVASLPDGAVALARTELCEIQAMRWGEHAYGLQFHAELTPSTVGEWSRIPEYQRSLEQALGREKARSLDSDTAVLLPRFEATARAFHWNFIELIAGVGAMPFLGGGAGE